MSNTLFYKLKNVIKIPQIKVNGKKLAKSEKITYKSSKNVKSRTYYRKVFKNFKIFLL